MSEQWEEVEVPRGSYIGWGFKPGQVVIGKVLSYGPTSGSDAKGNVCPEMALELTAAAESYRDRGTTKEMIAAGELVMVTAGLVSLKRALIVAQPKVGDLIKLTFDSTETVTTKEGPGEVKVFKVAIARGAARSASSPAQQTPPPAQSYASAGAEPPF